MTNKITNKSKKPIRVLHVINNMNCGGIEMLLMNLHRHINRNIIQFDYLLYSKDKCYFENEINDLGGKIFRVDKYTISNYFTFKQQINEFFKKHSEYRIVHGHILGSAHIYLKIANRYGCFTIAHSHSAGPDLFTLKNILRKNNAKKTTHIAKYFMACSQDACNFYFGKSIGLDKRRFCILHNAIDINQYKFNIMLREKIQDKYDLSKDDIVMGHMGRFSPEKNHDYLIDIFYECYKKNNHYKLLLIGDGELRNTIETKVKKLGISNRVIFTGVVNNVPDLLQRIDLFVFPSFFEGLSVAAIEAQAAGLPCFLSKTITEENALTDRVYFLDIKKDPSFWCNQIMQCKYIDRDKVNIDNLNNLYDISKVTKFLSDFYLCHS
ncbi:MAG: glycosyltransferase [Coriobacteriia bacterium]|nr:glycosyltransferase [Coriobacteriia bacterium]